MLHHRTAFRSNSYNCSSHNAQRIQFSEKNQSRSSLQVWSNNDTISMRKEDMCLKLITYTSSRIWLGSLEVEMQNIITLHSAEHVSFYHAVLTRSYRCYRQMFYLLLHNISKLVSVSKKYLTHVVHLCKDFQNKSSFDAESVLEGELFLSELRLNALNFVNQCLLHL